MKANKQIIIDEIIAEIEKGKSYTETLVVNGSKWKLPSTTFSRYWKTANEAFSLAIAERKRIIEKKTADAVLKHAEASAWNKIKKLQLLESIMDGSNEEEKVFFDKGVPKKVSVKPDTANKIKAVETHNKMMGHNEPDKLSISDDFWSRSEAEFSD